VESDTALATQREEAATTRATEREVAEHREAELKKSLRCSQAQHAECRWEALTLMVVHQRSCSMAASQVHELQKVACAWRVRSLGHERDDAQLTRQDNEIEQLVSEVEHPREENAQLLASFQQAKHDIQTSSAELRRLYELERACEKDAERQSELNVKLGSHSNPKQKIKHLEDLKTRRNKLEEDLKKSQQRNAQLESQLRSSRFYDGLIGCEPARGEKEATGRARSPSRRQGDKQVVKCSDAEAARHAEAHKRAAERAVREYQHLASLVEHLMQRLAGSSMTSVEIAGEGDSGTKGAGEGSVNESLLQRLRQLSASLELQVPHKASVLDRKADGVLQDRPVPPCLDDVADVPDAPHFGSTGDNAWIAEPEDEASLGGSAPPSGKA